MRIGRSIGYAVAIATLAVGGAAHALVEQPARGLGIRLVDAADASRNKLVLKMGAFTGYPTCPNTSALIVSSAATNETFTIALDCARWSPFQIFGPNPRMEVRYHDPTGATCNRIRLISSPSQTKVKVRAMCRGPQVDYDLGADQQSVVAVLRISSPSETYRSCATFSEAEGCPVRQDGTNGRYVARECSSTAPCPASPAGAFLESPMAPW